MSNSLINEVETVAGKTNSQFTKTWFMDRHIEAMVTYTDGTHYTYPTEYMDHTPRPGDPKHYEWVWNNNQWVQTVGQNY